MKTYILAPNFTTHPGGSIRLGTIIANPFRPTKPLSSAPDTLATVTHIDLERDLGHSAGQSNYGSCWAQFLQVANAEIGLESSSDLLTRYTMDSLETEYLKEDPTDEEAAARVQEPKIQAAMKAGMFGRRPVYMITGIKVAKGFRKSTDSSSERQANASGSVPIADQVSVGGKIGHGSDKAAWDYLRTEQDIIFAYQLHIIAQKGWRHERVEIDLYAPKAAFLSGDDQAHAEEPYESVAISEDDLRESAVEMEIEDEFLKSAETKDGAETCLCVWLDERSSQQAVHY